MILSEREITDLIADSMVMAFDAVVEALGQAPYELTAREAARDMGAARQTLVDKLAKELAEERMRR